MLCNLAELMAISQSEGHGLAAFNVYGYEDAKAVLNAAERLGHPVALMVNKAAVAHMGVELLGIILLALAQKASVPVGVHLDHATDLSTIKAAVDAGFTSVMFDGSQLPYEKNVKLTRQVVAMAAKKNVSVEAEIGAVGYSDPSISFNPRFTSPEEANRFYLDTGVDALAVAVGTIHRMESQGVNLQFELLKEIHEAVDVPLVIHGATGVEDADLKRLVNNGAVKINLGTVLRMAFGNTLRKQLEEDPQAFDRILLYRKCMDEVEKKAEEKMCAV